MSGEPQRKVTLERTGIVARVWLDRPQVMNAFDDELIAQLEAAVQGATSDPAIRVVVVGGRGKAFSAGADLDWMRRAAAYSGAENRSDAARLASMLRTLREAPKVTVARVHGPAMGGGLGLLSACDLALAVKSVSFAFTEVKLGLVPAVISPHVMERIGPGRARELFLTARKFDAQEALRLGLLDRVVDDEAALDAAVAELVEQVRAAAPGAIGAAKQLIRAVLTTPRDQIDAWTAGEIARLRASDEGREGILSFLEKRKPSWAT